MPTKSQPASVARRAAAAKASTSSAMPSRSSARGDQPPAPAYGTTEGAHDSSPLTSGLTTRPPKFSSGPTRPPCWWTAATRRASCGISPSSCSPICSSRPLPRGSTYVDPRGKGRELQMGLHDDGLIPQLARLVAAVHQHGGRVGPELNFGGRVVNPEVSGLESCAPSVVPYAG